MAFAHRKVKGNTLVEVLVALAIVSLSAALAMSIYSNIQKCSQSFRKLKANELSEFYLRETLEQRAYFDDTFKSEEYVVQRKIVSHGFYHDCRLVRILVFTASKTKIYELETTIFVNE